ncbi:MAG: hypothetical protein MUQ10_13150, partial [Anaerolineae bacterium]|nr:hypothetical protein [Anaerolineae bacterium]
AQISIQLSPRILSSHLDAVSYVHRAIRVVDGQLAGAMLIGERQGMLALLEAIGQQVGQYGADIARPDFPFNELTGQTWDYLFN